MRGQWLGVRRVSSTPEGAAAQPAARAGAAPLSPSWPVVTSDAEPPFHVVLRPLLTMPPVGTGSEDAVTPRDAAEVSDVDVSEVVRRWRMEKGEHTCGGCCGDHLLVSLDALGGVATLRELALASVGGPAAYAAIRTCVEAKATEALWRRSGRSVLVSTAGADDLLDAALSFRGAVDDARAHDADHAELAGLVRVHRLAALEELSSSRLRALVAAFGGVPRPFVASSVPAPASTARARSDVRPTAPTHRLEEPARADAPEGRWPRATGVAQVETSSVPSVRPSPSTRDRTGSSAVHPAARPAPSSEATGGSRHRSVTSTTTPSPARRLPRSPWAQPADETTPRDRLRALVDELLLRNPWSSAAEVTTELRRSRGIDVPRGEVNALLYRERDRYEQSGETPPLWRLSAGASGLGGSRPVVHATKVGGRPEPAVVVPTVVRRSAPLRPTLSTSAATPAVPATPLRLSTSRATPGGQHQPISAWRGERATGLRNKESQELALAAWRNGGGRGVIDGLDSGARLDVGTAAVAAAWRVGRSATVLTPDSENVEIWAQAVERAGVARRDVHIGGLGRLPPQRMGIVCVTTPFQARAHSVQAPRTHDNLVVVDELHRFMTGAGLRVLDDSYTRRLGLVTTPVWSDPSPGRRLGAYFDPLPEVGEAVS